jgi:hypothetical protein
VQGRLRAEPLTVSIETNCKHCGRPIGIEMDSDLNYRLADADARPLVFMPDLDWGSFREPNIIHAY